MGPERIGDAAEYLEDDPQAVVVVDVLDGGGDDAAAVGLGFVAALVGLAADDVQQLLNELAALLGLAAQHKTMRRRALGVIDGDSGRLGQSGHESSITGWVRCGCNELIVP